MHTGNSVEVLQYEISNMIPGDATKNTKNKIRICLHGFFGAYPYLVESRDTTVACNCADVQYFNCQSPRRRSKT